MKWHMYSEDKTVPSEDLKLFAQSGYMLMVRLQDNSDIAVLSVVPCTVPMSTSYENSLKTLPLSNEETAPL